MSRPEPIQIAEICGMRLEYVICRALPDTALVLRDVMRESARLWRDRLGAQTYEEMLATAEGEAFFTGRVRLEPVPPEREMVAVWLPFPRGFRGSVRPQMIDYIEAFDAADAPAW